MKILPYSNREVITSLEVNLQEQVDAFLKNQIFEKRLPTYPSIKELPKVVVREVWIPEIGRRSDHILLIDKKRAINIECKLTAIESAINQAKDHLKWADYSVIVIPPEWPYIPNKYKLDCINSGIGLWYWFNNLGLFEFILPSFNRKKDLILHKTIIDRVLKQTNNEVTNVSKNNSR